MRIGVLSDTHLSSPLAESNSLFPGAIASYPPEKQQAQYDRLRIPCEIAERLVRNRMTEDSLDLVVHTGDMVGGWKERGIRHESVEKVVVDAMENYREAFDNFLAVPGNHDLGYNTSTTEHGSGINRDAVAFWRRQVGELWWSRDLGNLLLLGIASPIAEYEGEDQGLRAQRNLQRNFLKEKLRDHPGGYVILFIHDASAVKHLADVLEPHLKRIKLLVYGDQHTPRFSWVMRILGYFGLPFAFLQRWRVVTALFRKSVLCPSTAPLWHKGCMYLTLDINPHTAATEATTHKLAIPTPIEKTPTNGLLRCAWWMGPLNWYRLRKQKRAPTQRQPQ